MEKSTTFRLILLLMVLLLCKNSIAKEAPNTWVNDNRICIGQHMVSIPATLHTNKTFVRIGKSIHITPHPFPEMTPDQLQAYFNLRVSSYKKGLTIHEGGPIWKLHESHEDKEVFILTRHANHKIWIQEAYFLVAGKAFYINSSTTSEHLQTSRSELVTIARSIKPLSANIQPKEPGICWGTHWLTGKWPNYLVAFDLKDSEQLMLSIQAEAGDDPIGSEWLAIDEHRTQIGNINGITSSNRHDQWQEHSIMDGKLDKDSSGSRFLIWLRNRDGNKPLLPSSEFEQLWLNIVGSIR